MSNPYVERYGYNEQDECLTAESIKRSRVDVQPEYVSVPLELIRAVAHIGVDFGYGEYKLEQKWLDLAREIYESNN